MAEKNYCHSTTVVKEITCFRGSRPSPGIRNYCRGYSCSILQINQTEMQTILSKYTGIRFGLGLATGNACISVVMGTVKYTILFNTIHPNVIYEMQISKASELSTRSKLCSKTCCTEYIYIFFYLKSYRETWRGNWYFRLISRGNVSILSFCQFISWFIRISMTLKNIIFMLSFGLRINLWYLFPLHMSSLFSSIILFES